MMAFYYLVRIPRFRTLGFQLILISARKNYIQILAAAQSNDEFAGVSVGTINDNLLI